MNKWKAGAKGRRSRRPKKVCRVPYAICGSFCVIGWLSSDYTNRNRFSAEP